MRSAGEMGIVFGPTVVTERRPVSAGTVGTIHVIEEGGRSCAYWHGIDAAEVTFLAAVESSDYASPEVRTQFMALVSSIAAHRERGVVAGKVASAPAAPWWASLPCAKCNSPQAADVMHLARQALELAELQVSPSGYPAGCCKIRVLGVINPSA
jgi:hypothetical protein